MARSSRPIDVGEWHQITVSRTGRLAMMEVDNELPVEVLSPGAFTQLSLPQNLYLGGTPNFGIVSPKVRIRSAFIGCIQKVITSNLSLLISPMTKNPYWFGINVRVVGKL